MSISCYFDYYLIKINKDPEFLKTRMLNVKEWLKALSAQGWWYDDNAPGLLFHACRSCICRVLQTNLAAKCSNVREILNSTCGFINSQHLLSNEENCLDKVHFELNSRMKCENTLDMVCTPCKSKLCVLVIDKELNSLNKSYIITRKSMC